MSDEVYVALITGGCTIIAAGIGWLAKLLLAVLKQVKNSHGMDLRSDLDDKVQGLHDAIAEVRAENQRDHEIVRGDLAVVRSDVSELRTQFVNHVDRRD